MPTINDRNNLEQIVKLESGELIPTDSLTSLTKTLFEGLDINLASRTDYKNKTPMFLNFIKCKGLNRNTYLEYKRQLDSRTDYSISTKAKYLTVAKVILKELNRQGYLPVDITSTIKGFKQSKNTKETALMTRK